MKLLYTATAYPPSVGGAQTHQHLLAQGMLHSGHAVQVVSHWDSVRSDWLLGTTIHAPTNSRDYVIDDVPVHRIGISAKEKLALLPYVLSYYPMMGHALPNVSRILQKHIFPYVSEVDLIHNIRIGRAGLSDASLQVARRRNVPFVLTPVHHPRWVGWRYKAYLDVYRKADAIMTLTESEKKIIGKLGVNKDRIYVIGHGPVLSHKSFAAAFREQHGIEGDFILFLGQHFPYKGYQQLLKAAPLVWSKFPKTHFVFVGPSVKSSDSVFSKIHDPRIHRLGAVSLQEKTNAISACTLLCVPSSQESFGGVYTEAWSFGKPVIGCKIPAVCEVVENGVNGFLVNQEVREIADRINWFLSHPQCAKKMGESGRQKVEAKYTWSRITEKLRTAYQRTMERYGS